MQLNFGPRGMLQIDDARIIFRNFEGREDKYNRKGDRNFALVIPNQEIADQLMEDTNEFGVGWKVKIRDPREEGDAPFMYLPVKVKFNDRGPNVYLKSGNNTVKLDEESIRCLDDIDILSIDLDIRPYDWEVSEKTGRTAYLQSMEVTQEVDRFAERQQREDSGF